MADFQMKCPRCGADMTVNDQWAGMQVSCPVCKSPVAVPQQGAQNNFGYPNNSMPYGQVRAPFNFKAFLLSTTFKQIASAACLALSLLLYLILTIVYLADSYPVVLGVWANFFLLASITIAVFPLEKGKNE